MIKVKVSDLINSVEALNELQKMKLDGRLAYELSRIMMATSSELQNYNEVRRNTIEKYCEKNEEGKPKIGEEGNYTIPAENVEAANKELTELAAAEIELNANYLNIKQLEKYDFETKTMMALMPFIEEE